MIPDAKPLDLTGVIRQVKNRVALVGVELEGAWKELPAGVAGLERDGSVFKDRAPAGIKHVGELPLGPVVPAAMPTLITRNHPHKINGTCGMHVHMSFESLLHYGLLMVPEYQETVLAYLTQWAKEQTNSKGAPLFGEDHYIWGRLRGESEFCRKNFWPDAQAATKRKGFDRVVKGNRYTVIHYCGRQNTIECRVLPMMSTPRHAVSAVQEVIDITNACIFILGKDKEQRLQKQMGGKIELPLGIVYQETIEERF
jgi:hypothetical protein